MRSGHVRGQEPSHPKGRRMSVGGRLHRRGLRSLSGRLLQGTEFAIRVDTMSSMKWVTLIAPNRSGVK